MTKSMYMWNPVRHCLVTLRNRPIGQNKMLVYDDATARDTALPSPSDGMVVVREDSGAISHRINSAWYDGLVGDKVRVIHPSGDYDTDTANIQNAIDDLTTTESGKDPGVILLAGGLYRINEPLVFGPTDPNDASDDKNPPRMIGVTTAHIRVPSTMTSDQYAIVYSGRHRDYEVGPYLSNIMLWCHGYCRGIRVHQATYAQALRDIHIRQATKVGLDWIDCWGSELRNVHVTGMNGIAIRTQGGGSILLDHVDWRGSGLTGEFPAVDEQLFQDYAGAWVQTTDEERAGLVIKSGAVTGHHLLPESWDGGDYPGIYIGAGNVSLANIRWEAAGNNDCRVRIADANNVLLRNMSQGESDVSIPDYLVRATGDCKGITVTDSHVRVARQGILCLDGGTHAGHRVSNIHYSDTYLYSPHNYIVQRNSPTLSGEPSAHGSSDVSIPWQ